MSTITLSLFDEDLTFLRTLSKAQGTSAEELLARQARNLRRRMERELPSGVATATGIIATEVDADKLMGEHLERKHLQLRFQKLRLDTDTGMTFEQVFGAAL